MKVNIVKPHHKYSPGIHEVFESTGIYLLRVGIAEKVVDDPNFEGHEDLINEKVTKVPTKEKKQIKSKKEKPEIYTKVPILKQ